MKKLLMIILFSSCIGADQLKEVEIQLIDIIGDEITIYNKTYNKLDIITYPTDIYPYSRYNIKRYSFKRPISVVYYDGKNYHLK